MLTQPCSRCKIPLPVSHPMMQKYVKPQVLWDSANKQSGLNLGQKRQKKAVPPGLGAAASRAVTPRLAPGSAATSGFTLLPYPLKSNETRARLQAQGMCTVTCTTLTHTWEQPQVCRGGLGRVGGSWQHSGVSLQPSPARTRLSTAALCPGKLQSNTARVGSSLVRHSSPL